MPGIPAQRLPDIRCRNNRLSSRLQHAVYLLQEQPVVLYMLNDLKTHHGVKLIGGDGLKRRNNSLLKANLGKAPLQVFNDFLNFIQPMISVHLIEQDLYSSTLAATDFQQIPFDMRLCSNVCLQQSLVNWVVTDQLIGGNFRCIGSHLKFHYFEQN